MTRPPSLDFVVAGGVRCLDVGRLRITCPDGEPITLRPAQAQGRAGAGPQPTGEESIMSRAYQHLLRQLETQIPQSPDFEATIRQYLAGSADERSAAKTVVKNYCPQFEEYHTGWPPEAT